MLIGVHQFLKSKFCSLQSCTVKSSETMLCYGPSFAWMGNETSSTTTVALAESTTSTIASMLSPQSFSNNHCLEFKFGFFMDDVEFVRNTSNYREVFLLCPDPIIYSFNNDGRRIQYRYDYLTIEGSNLLDVATINDYSITIGSFPCNITSISDKQIVCQPTNQTIEKLIRKKRLLLNINTKDSEQAIVRVSHTNRMVSNLTSFLFQHRLGNTWSANLYTGYIDIHIQHGKTIISFVLYHCKRLRISSNYIYYCYLHCFSTN